MGSVFPRAKLKKCKFKSCEFKYAQKHHIVPLSEGGVDTEENTIYLCPNHHLLAHKGLIKLPKGKKGRTLLYREKALNEAQGIFWQMILRKDKDIHKIKRLQHLVKKYNFDKVDFLSKTMGLSRKTFVSQYLPFI